MEFNGIGLGVGIAGALIFGLIGYAIGKPKGYPGVGFVLGFFFACIGLVIVAILRPSQRT